LQLDTHIRCHSVRDKHCGFYTSFVSGKWIIDISADGVSSCFDLGVKSDPELKGVIPNSFDHIFSHIARTENQQYLVRASFLEIYMVCFVQNCHLL